MKHSAFSRLFLTAVMLVAWSVQGWGQYFPVTLAGKWGLIDSTGKIVAPPASEFLPVVHGKYALMGMNSKAGVYEIDKDWVVPAQYDHIEFRDEDHSICFASGGGWMGDTWMGGVWGYYDRLKNVLVAPAFSFIDSLRNDGVLRVYENGSCASGECLGGSWKYLDSTGNALSIGNYEAYQPTASGFFLVSNEGMTGLLDSVGGVAIPAEFDAVIPVVENIFIVKSYQKFGLYVAGEGMKISPMYEDMQPMGEGLMQVREGTFWGLIDTSGKRILSASWDKIEMLSCGMIRMTSGDQVGMADLEGNIVLEAAYTSIWNCNNRFVQVAQGRLNGVANLSGKMVVEPLFTTILAQGSDWLCRNDSGSWVIDTLGNRKRTQSMDFLGEFSNGMAPYSLNGKWGVIHQSGRRMLNPVYDKVRIYQGVIICEANNQSYSFPVNEDGTAAEGNRLVILNDGSQNNDVLMRGSGVLPPLNTGNLISTGWFQANNLNYGWRDTTGVVKINPVYYSVSPLDSTNYTITTGGGTGKYLNGIVNHTTGKVISPPVFNFIMREKFAPGATVRGYVKMSNKIALISLDRGLVAIGKMNYAGQLKEGLRRFNIDGTVSFLKDAENATEILTLPTEGNSSRTYKMNVKVTKGLWGYLDTRNKIVALPKFEEAGDFCKGFAIVKSNGKYGVINTQFEFVVKPQYDKLVPLDTLNGSMLFTSSLEGTKVGFINEKGDFVIPCQFAATKTFHEGIAAVKQGSDWGYIREDGEKISEGVFAEAFDFHEGFARVRKIKSRYFGFIRSDGTDATSFKFSRAGNFSEGLAPAQAGEWGYIDTEGKWVIQPRYTAASDFVSGVAVVTRNGKSGLIDKNGKFILPMTYQKIGPIKGNYVLVKQNGKMGLATVSGEMILKPHYSEITFPSDGFIACRDGRFWEFADTLGKTAIKGNFTRVKPFVNGFASGFRNGNWGILSPSGKYVSNERFNDIGNFTSGLCPVMRRDKWQFTDSSGRVLYGKEYVQVRNFSDDLAAVFNGGAWGFIAPSGAVSIPPQFESVTDFVNGFALVKVKGKFGIIDKQGHWRLLPCLDEPPASIQEGLNAVSMKQRVGIVQSDGKELLPVSADKVTMHQNLIRVECAGKVGYLSEEGTWVWELNK